MREEWLSARYMVLSSLGFALMGLCVKLAGEQGIPVLEIIAARALVSLILSAIILKSQKLSLLGKNKPLLILRGLVGTFALICVYYAVVNIPFAEATVIQYLNPLFTAVLAAIFLGEHLKKMTLVSILISITVLLLVMQPEILFDNSHKQEDIRIYLIALLGALGSAIAYVLVRKLSATEDSNVIILYFPLVALPLSAILLGENFIVPTAYGALILILVGVFTQLGQWGLTKSIQAAPAGKAMSFSYLQVVFALLIGVIFFNEVPTPLALAGIVLIMVSTVLSVISKK